MSHLIVLEQRLAVCRLDPEDDIPPWVPSVGFTVLTRTAEELSILCDERSVPGNIKAEKGWRILKVKGPLDFSQVGVLATIAVPLAMAGVSIFAVSTYDTDYILVKESLLVQAVTALREEGHVVEVA